MNRSIRLLPALGLMLAACGSPQHDTANSTTTTTGGTTSASADTNHGRGVAEEPPHLEHWSEAHADASRALGDWVRQYPRAARAMFEWDAHNGEHPHMFVHEVAMRPEETLNEFVANHPEVHGFDNWAAEHRAATEAFMAWVRQYPQAAEALVLHHGSLAWAGEHIYSADWHLEHPDTEADAGMASASAPMTPEQTRAAAALSDGTGTGAAGADGGALASATEGDAGAHHGHPHHPVSHSH